MNVSAYLIQTFAGHFDSVHLEDFVVNGQQAGTFGQTAGHQT